jgi:hypothetical protein
MCLGAAEQMQHPDQNRVRLSQHQYSRPACSALKLLLLLLLLQNCDCDNSGTPQSNTGGCFFDPRAWARINAAEVAANEQLTPSPSFEESEFTLNRKNLTAFIEDGKLMASTLLPGECFCEQAGQCVSKAGEQHKCHTFRDMATTRRLCMHTSAL